MFSSVRSFFSSLVSLECPYESGRILILNISRLVSAQEVCHLVGNMVAEELDANVEEEEDAHQEGNGNLNAQLGQMGGQISICLVTNKGGATK